MRKLEHQNLDNIDGGQATSYDDSVIRQIDPRALVIRFMVLIEPGNKRVLVVETFALKFLDSGHSQRAISPGTHGKQDRTEAPTLKLSKADVAPEFRIGNIVDVTSVKILIYPALFLVTLLCMPLRQSQFDLAVGEGFHLEYNGMDLSFR
jgi:hypothetical protein